LKGVVESTEGSREAEKCSSKGDSVRGRAVEGVRKRGLAELLKWAAPNP